MSDPDLREPSGDRAGAAISANLVKAMSHPVRTQLMTRLDGKVASPRQLAAELGLPLPNVSYHVRTLQRLGMIELVEVRRSHGGLEHFYRGVQRPFLSDELWSKVPAGARRGISDVVLRDIATDVEAAVRAGIFDARDDRHLSRVPLVLDEQGWDEVRDLLAETLDALIAAQAGAAERMVSTSDDASIAAETAMLFFERPPGSTTAPDEAPGQDA